MHDHYNRGKMNDLYATVEQAAGVLHLWEHGRFDTLEIADAVGVSEAAACRIIHAAREAETASRELWAQVELITSGEAA